MVFISCNQPPLPQTNCALRKKSAGHASRRCMQATQGPRPAAEASGWR